MYNAPTAVKRVPFKNYLMLQEKRSVRQNLFKSDKLGVPE
jgi:hypothetical protein